MADTEDSHSLNNTDLNSVYLGDISQSRDGHMIFSGSAIKQENGGLLGKSSCTGLKLNFPPEHTLFINVFHNRFCHMCLFSIFCSSRTAWEYKQWLCTRITHLYQGPDLDVQRYTNLQWSTSTGNTNIKEG